jgi:hypothetical protein
MDFNKTMSRVMINEILIDIIEMNKKHHSPALDKIVSERHTLNNMQLIDRLKEAKLWPTTECDGKTYNLAGVE